MRPWRGTWWQPPLVALAAALLYLALGHDEFYKTDGTDIARLLDDHLQGVPGAVWPHPWHVGFLPALDAFRRVLASFGVVPTFVALGTWFSAAGAAVGIGFCHAAFLRLLPMRAAWFATALLALCPTTLLFATVVEYHGPLLAPVGACVWWATRMVARPSWWGMALLGALTHVAFLIHGQAMFLPLWLLSAFLVWRGWRPTPRDVAFAGVAGLVHLLLWWLLPKLLPAHYGFWADLERGFAVEASTGRPQGLAYLPEIVWQEWLRPLLPLSLSPFAALFVRTLRGHALALLLGLAPFVVVSVRLLVFEPEFGAYMLPMLPAVALLAAQLPWPRALLAAVLLATVANGLSLRPMGERDAEDRMPAAVFAAAGERSPFLLIGSHRELAVVYERLGVRAQRRDPLGDERFLWLRSVASMPVAQLAPGQLDGTRQFLELLLVRRRAVLITKTALASLDDPRAAMLAENPHLQIVPSEQMAGPRFAAMLREHFALRETGDGMLLELAPR